MDKIFKALRSLKAARPDLCIESREGAALRSTLLAFERANRGHQPQLALLASTALRNTPPGDDQKFHTRWWGFRTSMKELIAGMAETAQAGIPYDEPFRKFWTTKDESGCLQHFAVEYMRDYILYRMERPAWLNAQGVAISWDGGRIVRTIAFQHRDHPKLQATRTMTVARAEMDSLAKCAATLREYRLAADALIEQAHTWPEFAVQKIQDAIGERCTKRLRDALHGFSKEEKEWLAKNWAQLAPQLLPSGRLAHL